MSLFMRQIEIKKRLRKLDITKDEDWWEYVDCMIELLDINAELQTRLLETVESRNTRKDYFSRRLADIKENAPFKDSNICRRFK